MGINLTIEQRLNMINLGMEKAEEFHKTIMDTDAPFDTHLVIKPTFLNNLVIEEGEELIPDEFPSVTDVIRQLIQNKSNDGQIVKLLHILIDWVDAVDVKELIKVPKVD